MLYLYAVSMIVIGMVGSCAVGLFTPPAWKRFLLLGFILFLAFGAIGFASFAIGSLISLIDDWRLDNSNPRCKPIVFNKVQEGLAVGVFMIVIIVAIISIAVKVFKLIA